MAKLQRPSNWENEPAVKVQKDLLTRLKIDYPETLTKGQATKLIAKALDDKQYLRRHLDKGSCMSRALSKKRLA